MKPGETLQSEKIAVCVRHCANRRDGRGRWRAAEALAFALKEDGSSAIVALTTAAAARDFGAWLHDAAERARGVA